MLKRAWREPVYSLDDRSQLHVQTRGAGTSQERVNRGETFDDRFGDARNAPMPTHVETCLSRFLARLSAMRDDVLQQLAKTTFVVVTLF
jgi:hypothetical protein